MVIKIVWTDFAIENLQTIYKYYEDNANKETAQKIVNALIDKTIYLESHPEIWIHNVTATEIEETETALKHFFALKKPLIEIDPTFFPLPTFGNTLRELKDTLVKGRGFSLIRGFPISRFAREQQAAIFMGIGSYLGTRQTQNAKGHVLGHVTDITVGSQTKAIYDPDAPTTRIYATRKAQPFHVDGTDIVGLLCLERSEEGGLSSLISSHMLYNRLKELRPDILELLKENWFWDLKGENTVNDRPYIEQPPLSFYNRRVSLFWSPHFLETVTRFDISLPKERAEAIIFIQNLCEKEALNMWLEPGDMQFVHNHQLFHARGSYRDSPDHVRHLLRIWLRVSKEEGGWERRENMIYKFDVPHTVPLEPQ